MKIQHIQIPAIKYDTKKAIEIFIKNKLIVFDKTEVQNIQVKNSIDCVKGKNIDYIV